MARPRKAAAPVMPHRDGCAGERVESYTTSRRNGEEVDVQRCLDCGVQLFTASVPLQVEVDVTPTDSTTEASDNEHA